MSLVKTFTEVYFMPKLNAHIQFRAAFMLAQIFQQIPYSQIKFDAEMKDEVQTVVIDMIN